MKSCETPRFTHSYPALIASAAALLVGVSACGGGGSGTTDTPPDPVETFAPVTSNDEGRVNLGGNTTVDVLANDTDADDDLDATTVEITSDGTQGTATVNADGTITYSHTGSGVSDTFSYTVNDLTAKTSNTSEVSISVAVGVQDGLVAYFDAGVGVVAETDDVVTTWLDQSGNSNDLTAAGDPVLLQGVQNGNPAIDFDGTEDALERLDPANLPEAATDRTIYLVANYRGGNSGGVAYGAAADNQAFGAVISGGGQLKVQGFGGTNDFTSGGNKRNEWLVQSVVLESDTMTHAQNGTVIDTQTHTYDTGNEKLVVGSEIRGLANSPMDMQVATVLIYNRALDAVEQANVQSYLQAKYFNGPGSQPPVAMSDTGTVTAGGSVTVNVTTNDTDVNGNLEASTVAIVVDGAEGTAAANGDGTVTYTHTGAGTSDTFSYTVSDTTGLVSNTVEVTVTIN